MHTQIYLLFICYKLPSESLTTRHADSVNPVQPHEMRTNPSREDAVNRMVPYHTNV